MKRIVALIHAKYPEPGEVKTRMTPPLTELQAVELHCASLRAVWELVVRFTRLSPVLVVTPDTRMDETRRLLLATDASSDATSNAARDQRDVECWPQGDGDLGTRLVRSTTRAFDAGARGVVLLGADSPTLPPTFLSAAVRKLAHRDAVLGPTEDGGYYLLAMRRARATLFEGIDWGGHRVADQTRQRASASGIRLQELPYWYDLDCFADLGQAVRDLARAELHDLPAAASLYRLVRGYVDGTI